MSKNSSNPFTVPEGFFEEARSRAVAGASEVRRRRRNAGIALISGVAALVIVVAAGTMMRSRTAARLYDESAGWLASAEYDVFLANELIYENGMDY